MGLESLLFKRKEIRLIQDFLPTYSRSQGLLKDMERGHSLLKSAREKAERALTYLEDGDAEALRKEIHDHMEQLKGLTSTVRREHMTLEKGLHLAKEFSDKYKALTQWIAEYQEILHVPEEAKMELYEKKAQLSKYKVVCCYSLANILIPWGLNGREVILGVCHLWWVLKKCL